MMIRSFDGKRECGLTLFVERRMNEGQMWNEERKKDEATAEEDESYNSCIERTVSPVL